MATFDQFLPSLQPWVSDCPSHIVRNAARDALRLVCDECPVWQSKVPIGFIHSVTDYELDMPDDAELVEVTGIRLLDDNQPLEGWSLLGNTLSVPTRQFSDNVVLANVTLTLRPALDSMTMPDQLFSRTSAITPLGARWQLLDMPGKPWSDPMKGEYYRTRFYQQIGVLRGNIIHASQRNAIMQGAAPLA